jgi:hypothetical protein
MSKPVLFVIGVMAWAVVGLVASLIVFNIGDKNQILMFLPILATVVVAWAIGEVVTERVFSEHHEEGV